MKRLLKTLFSIVIACLVVLFFGCLAYKTIWNSLTTGNNYKTISENLYRCVPFVPTENTDKVVLRIDDIQAEQYKQTVMRMVKDTFNYKYRVTLGVIPNKLSEDPEMVNFISKDLCNIEVAQHGWDHASQVDAAGVETFEFENVDEASATPRIALGKRTLEDLFKVNLVSFIPPGNTISSGTKQALIHQGFKVVSGEGTNTFDYGASTYNWDTDTLETPEQVLSDCAVSFNKKHLCVIMIHPQDFETNGVLDEAKYVNYLDLLDFIKNSNYSVVTFSDVYQNYPDYAINISYEEYLVENSETLWDIAVEYYKDGTKWTKIYEQNKDKISLLQNGTPGLIKSGTKILIPIEN